MLVDYCRDVGLDPDEFRARSVSSQNEILASVVLRDDEDRAARALNAARCPDCGQISDEFVDPDTRLPLRFPPYRPVVVECVPCAALDRRQAALDREIEEQRAMGLRVGRSMKLAWKVAASVEQ